ncbi:MAG: hypothetical protein Q9217_000832 [Psora testacea]
MATSSSDHGSLNYFTCTLGEAIPLNERKPPLFHTISGLIDHQAKHNPDRPAVGFCYDMQYVKQPNKWTWITYTFRELKNKINDVAQEYLSHMTFPTRTVGLLCSSGRDYLLTWLALIRIGCTVLLVAPELTDTAIADLCQMASAMTLLYDEKHSQQACHVAALMERNERFNIQLMPKYPNSATRYKDRSLWATMPADVAYIHHTSGTSTGKPKPIPITHHGAVGVLPVFEDLNVPRKATFTTTPLYHGGPADVFRAWTSSSMIWLFPGVQDKPITADNVLRAIDVTERFCKDYPYGSYEEGARVRYLTCVPFIVEIIAEKPEGLNVLRKMELVGVGGAALSTAVGDRLVGNGVNLISRYGSAECGFIFSSRRNYDTDKEWEYLRLYLSTSLRLEIQENGLAELVIQGWPFMAKSNRPGGAYATADLFEAHPSIPHAWKYHSRADSQLTLSTGKKFDPAPLEAKILAFARASRLLSEIYIFGNGRPYPGALLFRSHHGHEFTDNEVREHTFKTIDQVNADLPPYARIAPHMLTVMPLGSPELRKSSKGTILRPQVEKDFAMAIDQTYTGRKVIHPEHLQKEDIGRSVDYIVKSVLAEKLRDGRVPWFIEDGKQQDEQAQETSKIEKHLEGGDLWTAQLFDLGLNSIEAMQIRAHLNDNFGHLIDTEIPLNIVYDCGTAQKIATYILELHEGKKMGPVDQTSMMRDLVSDYGGTFLDTRHEQYADSLQKREVVVLTGVTGTLGAWIFNILRFSDYVGEIHCLIRAAHHYAAKQRIIKALEKRRFKSLESSKAQVYFYPCTLSERSTLGLGIDNYKRLVRKATLIIHAAWEVNFSLALPSFEKDHIGGLHNLIEFANSSPNETPPSFIFCSSTASVLGPEAPTYVEEKISHDPNAASAIGYSRSKWVAESICEMAHLNTRLHGRISVLRIGQLCGDGVNGVWNVTEAWPLMFSSVKVTGCLPDLQNEKLNWLRVDLAAQAVVQVAYSMLHRSLDPGDSGDDDDSAMDMKSETDDGCMVYHVINRNTTPIWSDLLQWIQALDPSIETVSPAEWVSRLESLRADAAKHPSRKLLGMWKAAYCGEYKADGRREVAFEMERTLRVAPVLSEVQPISEEHFKKIWSWLEKEMESA